MFRTSPGPDRARLAFAEQALSAFDFLKKEYDFHVVEAEPTFVRYESPSVFVNIYHGRASFELGFEVGRLSDETGKEEQPYSLSMIIELMGAQDETGYTFLQASTQERVKEFVPKLASLVKSYAASALKGDPSTFKQLAVTRSQMSDQLHKDMKLRDVREQAAKAWQTKNYVKLADLYESIFEDLTPAEIKKLDYVNKRLP